MSDLTAQDREERLVDPASQGDDRVDVALRPDELDAFIGQPSVRENLSVFVAAARRVANPWTMCCFTARRGWVKLLWRGLWPRNLASDFGPRPGP